ncbi:MAG: hypothetical protein NDI84_13595 [Steroidobacteraceae bacterium]|nr:hypothetical protein [Steroidobacteraceae bacterium]
MNTRTHLFAALAAALPLFLAVPGTAAADVTEAQIAAAKTPADHEAIAQSYDAEATAADAKAKAHEGMSRTYKTGGGAPKAGSTTMTRHCDRLMKAYTTAAVEYRALAAEHRKLAADSAK